MQISTKLIQWYRQNKRELPWRETQNPYYIWLSEIILQQTRVAQGLNYYLKFVKNYPTVKDLASAPEEMVLKDWQGLGYYSRARNLQTAARMILNDHKGEFPGEYSSIRALKGVGDYTAAAIASISYDLPYPVLDGNVYRVISRLFAIETPIDTSAGKKEVTEALHLIFDPKSPGEFNQAIMEFGALYCVPKNPDCMNCTLRSSCLGFEKKLVDQLPRKAKTTKVRNRYFYYLVLEDGPYTYIQKREGKDIWEGLFQFPLVETTGSLTQEMIESHPEIGKKFRVKEISREYKHVLSHQNLFARFVKVHPEKKISPSGLEKMKWIKIRRNEMDQYAVPRLIDKYLQDAL